MWSEVYTSSVVANRAVPSLANMILEDKKKLESSKQGDEGYGYNQGGSFSGTGQSEQGVVRPADAQVDSIPKTASSLAKLLSLDANRNSHDHPTFQALSFLTSTDRTRLDFSHAPTMRTFTANLVSSSTHAHAGASLHPPKHQEQIRTTRAGPLAINPVSLPHVQTVNPPAADDREDDRLVDLFFALGGTEFKEAAEAEQAVSNPSVWLTDLRSRSTLFEDSDKQDQYVVNFIVESGGLPRVMRTMIPKDKF
jgi:hypothetical protein